MWARVFVTVGKCTNGRIRCTVLLTKDNDVEGNDLIEERT